MSAIQVSFAVEGLKQVRNAFENIADAQKRFEKSVQVSASNEIRTREKAAKTVEQMQERRFAQLQRTLEREGKAAELAEAKKLAAIERTERANIKIQIESAKMAQRDRDREVAAHARAEQQKLDIQLRSAKAAGRISEDQVNAEIARRKRLTHAVTGTVSNAIGGAIGTAGRVGGSILALGSGFITADAVHDTIASEKAAIKLSNAAYIPGQTERPDKAVILARASRIAEQTNLSKSEIIGGLQKYTELSSDFSGGFANLGEMAKMAKGQGMSMETLMSTAGAMRVQNPNLDSKGMMSLLRQTVGQGKFGAISFEDLAAHAGTATSTAAQYAGGQAENQGKLLGLTQLARRVADPAEAARSVERLATDLSTHVDSSGKIGGVQVKGKDGLFDSAKIISDLMRKTGGDVGKLHDLGIGEMSMKLFNAAAPTFKAAGGGEAGAKAVEAEIKGMQGATYSAQDVEKDFAEVMKGAGEKFDAAVSHLREVVETKLAPLLEKFADKLPELLPKIEALMESFAKVSDFLMENPYAGIAALIMAEVTAEIGKAAIGASVKAALETQIGQALGVVAIPVAAMAVTAAVVNMWADEAAGKQKRDTENVVRGGNEARDLLAKVRDGSATPADEKRIKELQNKTANDMVSVSGRMDLVKRDGDDTTFGKVLYNFSEAADLGGSGSDDAKKLRLTGLDTTFKGLADNAGLLNKALKELADRAREHPKNAPEGSVNGAHPARSSR